MPRGIPNAKRDDAGLKYTSFHVPLLPNPKQAGSSYLRSETQTLWGRNTRTRVEEPPTEGRRGSQVIVIHPGSRWLRIGRASDVNPVSVPHVIARKHNDPVPPPTFSEGISRPAKGKAKVPAGSDPYNVVMISNDPANKKIAAIAVSLRDRMNFYKLPVNNNAADQAASFNTRFVPEVISDQTDPYRVRWITDSSQGDVIIGEKIRLLSDPQKLGYSIKWPIYGGNFNTRDYNSIPAVLNDLEHIWTETLETNCDISRKTFKDFSVVLVIPDLWDRFYVREILQVLLVNMGFKQACAQQESLAATYGAGVSNACVVDIGAIYTTVACVDDGLVIADTRIPLSIGGDDITEFLYVLLDKINFPYKELNLARSYDWNVMEDLKERICTLQETDVALNLWDFVVRRPGIPTQKYGLRAYDEVILAAMCLFEPRVIEFENKRLGLRPVSDPDVSDEVMEYLTDRLTHAMLISTQHLMPQVQGPMQPSSPGTSSAPAFLQAEPAFSVAPQPAADGVESSVSNFTGSKTTKFIFTDPSIFEIADSNEVKGETEVRAESTPGGTAKQEPTVASVPTSGPNEDVVMEPVRQSEEKPIIVDSRAPTPPPTTVEQPQPQSVQPANQPLFLGNLPIDVVFEASKLPLEVAIFNSARAAGGDEKIRKYLQAVLVVGGTARVKGMAHALESRLQAIATPLVPNMEKVQIIPPPKEVDHRVLVWKGAAVLAKMEGVSDLWVTRLDWDIFGMRALKERCYFL